MGKRNPGTGTVKRPSPTTDRRLARGRLSGWLYKHAEPSAGGDMDALDVLHVRNGKRRPANAGINAAKRALRGQAHG